MIDSTKDFKDAFTFDGLNRLTEITQQGVSFRQACKFFERCWRARVYGSERVQHSVAVLFGGFEPVAEC
jgi:hypothetical protein